MSEVEKEDKSFSVEDQLPSKQINYGSRKVVFAHQASAGDKSIDLNNLVIPSSMSSNGFSQPLSNELASAHLTILRNNLTLISTRGALTQYLDYVISDSGSINFLETSPLGVAGALEGEIFTGTVDEVRANSLIVGDMKELDTTADDTNFTPGDTVINVGAAYNVGENINQQSGEIRVYKNGMRLYRNVGNAPASASADGNYHEVDNGTGKGTTIELNVPAQAGDMFGFDFGIKVSSGDLQLWGAVEKLQGSVLKLAQDAAPIFGNPLNDYIIPNASEVERRGFGDTMQKILNMVTYKEEWAVLRDERADNVNGGNSPTLAYFDRFMNVKHDPFNFVEIGLNGTTGIGGNNTQFRLPAGTFKFQGWSATTRTDNGNTRLFSVTDNLTLIWGPPSFTTLSAGANHQHAPLEGYVTLTKPTILLFQHFTESDGGTNAIGDANQHTVNEEFYALLNITKITRQTVREAIGL